MLRATHCVLLFVIFVCAYAAPAFDGSTIASDLEPLDQTISGSDDLVLDNSDLDTDATAYWGYYRPSWNYYHRWGRGWGHGRGWGGGWGNPWRSYYWY